MDKKRTLIIGAGECGRLILNDIRENMSGTYDLVGFIDDDKEKIGEDISSLRVLSNTYDIKKIILKEGIDYVILAIPSLETREKNRILNILSDENLNISVKIIPEVKRFKNEKLKIRDIEIEDLLERDPVDFDFEFLLPLIGGRTVLITGGGGSIGSELARQVSNFKPKKLILLDIYENGVYDIQMELKGVHPDLDLLVLIESVRDLSSMDYVFRKYSPEIVFHAASHKHVPLMEDSAQSAIKNNVFGTYNVALKASEYGALRFVLISTDKAINPTSVMGATKAFCERTIRYFNGKSNTIFTGVRFGNVLDSNGSVIPLFRKQIKNGGPVTVTSENIYRYFMTIDEACQLVLKSAGLARGGEIFILDMGKAIRIIDLAERLISLSGYRPYEDIDIKIIGLRPGEKLFEEILLDKTKAIRTENEKIYIDMVGDFSYSKYERDLESLRKASFMEDIKAIREVLKGVIGTYNPYIKD